MQAASIPQTSVEVHQLCLSNSLTVPAHTAGAPGSSADDSLRLELAAAQAAGEALRKELAASQRQTESAVNQLRDVQMRIDRLQVLASWPGGTIPQMRHAPSSGALRSAEAWLDAVVESPTCLCCCLHQSPCRGSHPLGASQVWSCLFVNLQLAFELKAATV